MRLFPRYDSTRKTLMSDLSVDSEPMDGYVDIDDEELYVALGVDRRVADLARIVQVWGRNRELRDEDG